MFTASPHSNGPIRHILLRALKQPAQDILRAVGNRIFGSYGGSVTRHGAETRSFLYRTSFCVREAETRRDAAAELLTIQDLMSFEELAIDALRPAPSAEMYSLGIEPCLVGRLNSCWSSPAQSSLTSGLVEVYDQDFYSLLDVYEFRNGASYSTRGWVGVSMQALRLLHRSISTGISVLETWLGSWPCCYKFSSYRTENTLHFHCKDQWVNADWDRIILVHVRIISLT
jgi:hypothetical protein